MSQEELFSFALGVSKPWFIKSIDLDIENHELKISVDFEKGAIFNRVDKVTGEVTEHKAYDTVEKTWRHMNFFQFSCFIKARVPRVKPTENSVEVVSTPWEGAAHGFTLLFEAFIIQLAKSGMTVHQLTKLLGKTYDNKIWKMLHLYTETARSHSDYSEVESIGIDETAVRRGHDYVTTFVDLKEKKTIYVTEGKSNETVIDFVEDLKLHHGEAENITQVSCDMSPAFIKGVEENLPNAKITFDKFHVIKKINEAVNNVRRREYKTNPILKDSMYVVLKNKENLTKTQLEKLEELKIENVNLDTYKAMQMRETFQQIYQSGSISMFEKLLKKWIYWVKSMDIKEMIEVVKTIKNHWNGIVNWAESQINNGILEGFNSIFQACKAKSRGYTNLETIRTVIYINTAKLDYSKVNPLCSTHSFL
jgi:transposase